MRKYALLKALRGALRDGLLHNAARASLPSPRPFRSRRSSFAPSALWRVRRPSGETERSSAPFLPGLVAVRPAIVSITLRFQLRCLLIVSPRTPAALGSRWPAQGRVRHPFTSRQLAAPARKLQRPSTARWPQAPAVSRKPAPVTVAFADSLRWKPAAGSGQNPVLSTRRGGRTANLTSGICELQPTTHSGGEATDGRAVSLSPIRPERRAEGLGSARTSDQSLGLSEVARSTRSRPGGLPQTLAAAPAARAGDHQENPSP
jgi:hypothetical protein